VDFTVNSSKNLYKRNIHRRTKSEVKIVTKDRSINMSLLAVLQNVSYIEPFGWQLLEIWLMLSCW